jgi:hypothetical protein
MLKKNMYYMKYMSVHAPTEEGQKQNSPAHTEGEKLFDTVNYFGLGWFVNTASSLYLTEKAIHGGAGWDWLKNGRQSLIDGCTKFGLDRIDSPTLNAQQKQLFDKITDIAGNNAADIQTLWDKGHLNEAFYELRKSAGGSFEKLAEAAGSTFTPETMKELRDYTVRQNVTATTANTVATIMSICAGGFLVMLPMKIMEDHKLPITKFLDAHVAEPFQNLTGKAPKTQEEREQYEAEKQARYDAIERAPKQTWKSIITSRLAAVVPIWVAHAMWAQPNNIIKSSANFIAGNDYANPNVNVGFGGLNHYTELAGNKVGGVILDHLPTKLSDAIQNTGRGAEGFKQKTDWFLQDFFYSYIVANSTYQFTRIFGPMFGKEQGAGEASPPPSPVADGATPSAPQAANNIVPLKRVGSPAHHGAVHETGKELSMV